ncbi:forkhead box protein D5-C-like [Dreissena polymorpha]|nr:forkhead box protein D5-C-like [Dreissena polymorpha]
MTTPNIGDHVITPSHELTRASSNPIPESPESKCKPPKDTNGQTSGPEDEQLKTPGLSYIALISMAIQSSSEKRMLLSEIYSWISERFPYYQLKEKSWRNSIRHNLSLNECFVKNGRSENGKGNYWSIHPANIEDFAKGDYRRRRARRRVRKCDEDLQRLCSETPAVEVPVAPCQPKAASPEGYVPMATTLVPANFLSIFGVHQKKPYDYWTSSARYSQYDLPQPYSYIDSQDLAYIAGSKDFDDGPYKRQRIDNTTLPYAHFDEPNLTYSMTSSTDSALYLNNNVNVCEAPVCGLFSQSEQV